VVKNGKRNDCDVLLICKSAAEWRGGGGTKSVNKCPAVVGNLGCTMRPKRQGTQKSETR
jgi:hypothetical protein